MSSEAGEERSPQLQRLDRHFAELLQELRVAQTGVQILLAFLLGLAFAPPFADLAPWQHAVYLATLGAAAAAAAVLIAPVCLHRVLYGRGMRPELIRSAHRTLILGLGLLLGSVVGGVLLASSMVLGRDGLAVAGGVLVVFLLAWLAHPLVVLRHGRPGSTDGREPVLVRARSAPAQRAGSSLPGDPRSAAGPSPVTAAAEARATAAPAAAPPASSSFA